MNIQGILRFGATFVLLTWKQDQMQSNTALTAFGCDFVDVVSRAQSTCWILLLFVLFGLVDFLLFALPVYEKKTHARCVRCLCICLSVLNCVYEFDLFGLLRLGLRRHL